MMGSTNFNNLDEAWTDYANQCVDEDELDNYTQADIRDDFYSGAIAALVLLDLGVPLADIRRELIQWHDENLELTI
jgi:hypothetical protein